VSIKPIDLRDILDYVPRFRNHIFVIGIDGSVVVDTNFQSVLVDIAVLSSLNIKIVIVFGIGQQMHDLADARGFVPTNNRGEGPTDGPTLALALECAALTANQVMQGLSQQQLPYAITNTVESRPVGIVKGVDYLHTGICEKVDLPRIHKLLDDGVIPVFPPIAYTQHGEALRLNSDQLAASLSAELQASKLIYLTTRPGLSIDGEPVLNLSAEELDRQIDSAPEHIDPLQLSKAKQAVRVLSGTTQRVHILDGRVDGGLLTEIFDKVGLGTMIHSNEYDRIRTATEDDVADIYSIIKQASKQDFLRFRSLDNIRRLIRDFLVYEVDDSVLGCTSLIPYPDENVVELASVCVQPFHQGKGIGQKLVGYAIASAKARHYSRILALSTQAFGFFEEHFGFREGGIEALPASRRQELSSSNRNSRILVLDL